MPTLADPAAEADRIVNAAAAGDVVLRLFGGVAVSFRCPSTKHRSLQRNYVDIDFMGYSKQSKTIKQLLKQLGYLPRERFNAMQGDRRLIFNDMDRRRRVDIFLDSFVMCHRFDLKDRLEIDRQTIPLADLLATKLQIIEINEKDIRDILSMLLDYEIGNSDKDMINGAYLANLCAKDWGVYKTFTLNLEKTLGLLTEGDFEIGQKTTAKARVEKLKTKIERAPKSLRWKLRERVGEKVRWYELPEADKEVVD